VIFTRDSDGDAVNVPPSTPFMPDTDERRGWINLLWGGQNNSDEPDRILADLRGCVASLRTDHYAVLGLLNREDEGRGTAKHDQIVELNARMRQEFGDHYLDVRQLLIDHYNAQSARDQADVAADVPPSSLRADDLHPNDAGYAVIAAALADFIRARGW